MKKIKVAQIGTSQNGHGNFIWKSLLKQTDCFEVVGYAFHEHEREKFPKQAAAFDTCRELSVEEILRDPEIEAVAVETEEIYLTKYAQMVADAGKHLHMEKPGGTDLAEFEHLVDTLQAKGLVFSTGYMYRHNPMIKEVLEQVRRGKIGKVYAVEAHMDCWHKPETRAWLKDFPGGMMFYLGCHLIDLIYQIQGEPLEVLPLSCATGTDGVDAEDYGMAVLRYPGGISFAKTCANERGGFARRQLVICGEQGTIELRPLEEFSPSGQIYTTSHIRTETSWHAPEQCERSADFDRYDAMMQSFAELVRGKKNPYSYDYERALFRLLMRACGKEI